MSNQDSTQNVPALRLDGFEGEWEESSVGEEAPVTMGQSPTGDTYRTTPSGMILVQGNADLENGWVKPRVWTTQPVRTAKAGTLIMSVRAPVGAIGKTQYPVALGRGVAGIEGNDFIFHYLGFLNQSEFWNRVSSGSTFESVNGPTIRNTPITLPPTDEEQQAIGAVFTNLDNAIDQHANKHRVLQRTKTALMQKMFPQDGQTEPELRMDGFDGEWSTKSISNLSGRAFGGGTPPRDGKNLWSGDIPWIQSSDVSERGVGAVAPRKHISRDAVLHSAASTIPANSVAVVTRVGVGKVALMPFRYVTSQDFISLTDLVGDPTFIAISVKRHVLSLLNQLQGSTIKGITKNELLSQKVTLPSTVEEQQAIGAVFTKLDSLISAEAQLIEKLKQTKTALLQKMFV